MLTEVQFRHFDWDNRPKEVFTCAAGAGIFPFTLINWWQKCAISHTTASGGQFSEFFPSKPLLFQTWGNKKKPTLSFNFTCISKCNSMTTPAQKKKKSHTQQLETRKWNLSRGMRAAAHARATAINHGMAVQIKHKGGRKEKSSQDEQTSNVQMHCGSTPNTPLYSSCSADKLPSLPWQNMILSRAHTRAQCVPVYDKRIRT